MKQPVRLIARPATFMNQLQWSRRHWFIISLFLGLGVIETFVGRNIKSYEFIANRIQLIFGFREDISFIFLLVIKLFLMLFILFFISYFIWLVGGFFNHRASLRVLIRRFATAFSILLLGYIIPFLLPGTFILLLKYGFYFWGITLSFFLVKEQFNLTFIESFVVGCLSVLIAISIWHFSNIGLSKIYKLKINKEVTHNTFLSK